MSFGSCSLNCAAGCVVVQHGTRYEGSRQLLEDQRVGDCLVGNLGELLCSSNAEKYSGELNLVFLKMFLAALTAVSAVTQWMRGLEKLGLM